MKFVQAKHGYFDGRNKPRLIVIHDMEYPERPTGAEWCADFFAGANGMTAPKASAHFCVDNDSIVQCVKEDDGAWHTPGALPSKGGVEINRSSIGIEHAGYAKQTAAEWRDDYSTAMLEMSAGLVAELCVRHRIPAIRLTPEDLLAGKSGICGHADCTKATGVGTHWDPGPNFPWDWYMERVTDRAGALMEAPPELPKDDNGWVVVHLGDETWRVAPIYVPYVGIGQAKELAERLGCELPTPALVDAIWLAADLRIDANQMPFTAAEGNDFSGQTMASMKAFELTTAKLARAVGDRKLGTDYHLLAGAYKDVVRDPATGRAGLYGWHRRDGSVIQPPYYGHAMGWLDYSHGLRLCRRMT